MSVVFSTCRTGLVSDTQDPGTGPPITVRKGITRLPIRFSFFAAAAVTTTLFDCSPHATGDLWVWASFLFSVEEQVFIQVTFRVPFAVPWATLSGLLTEQRKERGPRESFKENFTDLPGIRLEPIRPQLYCCKN